MAVYSRRFYGGIAGAKAAVEVQVPAGVVWVVRCIDVVESTTGPIEFKAGIQTLNWFFQFKSADGGPRSAEWRGRQVLYAGEVLFMTAIEPVFVSASGYELDAAGGGQP